MKKLAAPRQDFAVYVARPETRWIEREAGDSLSTLYERGYLPYSGAKDVANVFYSARSSRVALQNFAPTSENRRIAKKFDGTLTKERVPAAEFVADERFYDFCLAYFAAKHGERAMPRERLEVIMQSGLVTTVVTYRFGGQLVAYVLEVAEGAMAHYWFSFYDLAYARQSLGLWLMQDCIQDAKARGHTHYYLGTVYGSHALYKTNFEPLEWWDGTGWSRDTALLKTLAKQGI